MPCGSERIVVWAGLRVQDGAIEAFKELAAPVIEATRQEPGCIKYDLLQDSADPQTFYFFEEYADENAYKAHREMSYMPAMREGREKLLDKYLGIRVFSERFVS